MVLANLMSEALLRYGPANNVAISVKKNQRYYLYVFHSFKDAPGTFFSYRLYRLLDGRIFGLPESMALKCISTRYTKALIAAAPDGCIWDDHQDKHNRAMMSDDGKLLHWCLAEDPQTQTVHTYYTIMANA